MSKGQMGKILKDFQTLGNFELKCLFCPVSKAVKGLGSPLPPPPLGSQAPGKKQGTCSVHQRSSSFRITHFKARKCKRGLSWSYRQ